MSAAIGKRIMVSLVGAGIGSLVGLLISFLANGNNIPLFAGAALGAVVPLLVLGKPN